MLQIFVLLVLANLFGGLVIASPFLADRFPSAGRLGRWYDEHINIHPLLIISLIISGVLGLIFPYNGISVLGDFLPAMLPLISAFVFFLNYAKKKGSELNGWLGAVDNWVSLNTGTVGLSIFGIGILHFIFPGAVLL